MKYGQKIGAVWLSFVLLLIGGCRSVDKKIADGQPVTFTMVDENELPEEMKERVKKMEGQPFQITYMEGDWLYIGQGYGKQETKGYAIRVDRCLEGKEAIAVKTTLLGPGSEEIVKEQEVPENVCIRADGLSQCPYVIWKVARNEKPVIFE